MWRMKKYPVSKNDKGGFFASSRLPKNLLKTLKYIHKIEKIRPKSVTFFSDIAQPEISFAMKELEKRGWIGKGKLKKLRKSQSLEIYTLKNNKQNSKDNQYNVFVYDMIRYPPKCNPPENKNT
jgi:predicted transcriptional regulator